MGRGGYRAGSGRKSNAEIAEVRKIMDGAIEPAAWDALFARLMKLAKGGGRQSVAAAHLLLGYRFGMPRQPVDLSGGEPVTLHLHLPEIQDASGVARAPGRAGGVSR